MKISVTNKTEFNSAKNHIYDALERIYKMRSKCEKRGESSKKLDELYKILWKANELAYQVKEELEVTIGGI